MTTTAVQPAAAHDVRRAYLVGVLLLVAGALAFSSAGYFVRLIGRDAATILFWRGIFTTLAVLMFVAWQDQGRVVQNVRGMGLPGIAVALLAALSMASFVTSLQYTTVANNSIIFGIAPFITAGLAWAWIAERPSFATLVFSGVAMLGAILVVASSLAFSAKGFIGDALAVLMTVTFAVKTVLVRQHRARSMIAAGALGALFGSMGAAMFQPTFAIGWSEVALFALFGFTQQGAGLILTTIGTARVPAAHAALLMSLDLPLAPLWVWLAFGEQPTLLGLCGGLVVLAAIVGHILVEGRRKRF